MCDLSMKLCQYMKVNHKKIKESQQEKTMKNILMSLVVISMLSGCALFRKSSDSSGVVSETTGSGSSEKVDSSGMNFSPTGSDSGTIDGLQTVNFEYDKATLTETEQKKLEGNAVWLKKFADVKMMIEGHCDQRGSNEYNLSLGERRANAVKRMLMKMGIASKRLSTTSYGEEKPLSNGDSEQEMAQNRRANFVPQK